MNGGTIRAFLLTFMLSLVVFSGCTLSETERYTESQLPPVLLKVQQLVQSELLEIDSNILKAANQLSKTGLSGAEVRNILLTLRNSNPHIVDCSTVNLKGIMVVVEPFYYSSYEGSDISGQEQVARLLRTGAPVMSAVFEAVEGFNVVNIARPIYGSSGQLMGSVSAIIRAESLLAELIEPEVEGFPIDCWAMQLDGRIIYDPDFEEIGRILFTDELYKPYKQLIALGRYMVRTNRGSGTYEFLSTGLKKTVTKMASWVTVRLHGSEWRLVVVQVLHDTKGKAKRSLEDISLPAYRNELRKLVDNSALHTMMRTSDNDGIIALFKAFIESYPGINSIQWMDERGINMFGYPKPNSLHNYNYRSGRGGSDAKFLEALAEKKEVSFVMDLIEGGRGFVYLVPILDGDNYRGMLFTVRILP